MSARATRAAALAVFAGFHAGAAHAFKLEVWQTGLQQPPAASGELGAFMRQLSVDVHERITRDAYAAAGIAMPAAVIAGVRWNDNPPAMRIGRILGGCGGAAATLPEGISCWGSLMRIDRVAVETLTDREKSIAPVRSHFGDMQFLHAMAARTGEPAEETLRGILRWSEFAWRVARGEIAPKVKVSTLGAARSPLDAQTGAWIGALFGGASKKSWTVQDLFGAAPEKVQDMAFGSLLHLVQDSYSAAHVRRATQRIQPNGCLSYDAGDAILHFHTYAGQDAEKHGVCDDAPDWLGTPRPGSPIEAFAALVRAYHEGREWPAAKAILEERVFRLAPSTGSAQPGRCYDWRFDSAHADSRPEPIVAIDAACQQELPQ